MNAVMYNYTKTDSSSPGEKKASTEKQQFHEVEENKQSQPSKGEEANQRELEYEMTANLSSKTSSEITEEESPQFSSDRSTMTEDSTKLEQEKFVDTGKQNLHRRGESLNNSSSRYSNPSVNKNKKMEKNDTEGSGSPFSSPLRRIKSRSQSIGGASHIFRNLIRCGAIDTKDSVSVKMSRPGKPASSKNSTKKNSGDKAEICKGDKLLGGSARILGTSNLNHQPHYTARYVIQKFIKVLL